MKIEDLGLSARAYNVLKRARIDTIEQLQQLSDDDLLRLRNMGVCTLKEIREKVEYVKSMTNADRIRAMSNEELAKLFCGFCMNAETCKDCPLCAIDCPEDEILSVWEEWMKQRAED